MNCYAIELRGCPCCGNEAGFKRYLEGQGLYCVHIACLTCGMRGKAATVYAEEPPADDWSEYAELAKAWNQRVTPKVVIKLPAPDAWREFDGEGGYDFREYTENEEFRDAFRKRNSHPQYKDWVVPLYAPDTLIEHLLPQLSRLAQVTLMDEV